MPREKKAKSDKPKNDDRNRSALARAAGKRQCMFEITNELDSLIEQVRQALAVEMGGCTRTQALERIGREGSRIILEKNGKKE